jgi:O-antigen/teichoic acid export membrane protein
MLLVLPLDSLFGLAATASPPQALRTAAILACIGTIAAIPLSVVDSARQAYQEVHISNLFGALTNTILCLGLLLTAWLAPTLPAFVAVTALSPLVVRLLNAAHLVARRPHLADLHRNPALWPLARQLAGDGVSYMGAAAIANVLIYQWPVYYVARVRPPLESSTFAVYIQLVILVLSFGVSLAQPLWPAISDAAARGDRRWITRTIWRARATALAYGTGLFMAFGFMMTSMLRMWMSRPIHLSPEACWLAGTYVLLATWEYVHWPLALGLGAMRVASATMFWRAVTVAVAVPLVAHHGLAGIMAVFCISVVASTAWFYPMLVARIPVAWYQGERVEA